MPDGTLFVSAGGPRRSHEQEFPNAKGSHSFFCPRCDITLRHG